MACFIIIELPFELYLRLPSSFSLRLPWLSGRQLPSLSPLFPLAISSLVSPISIFFLRLLFLVFPYLLVFSSGMHSLWQLAMQAQVKQALAMAMLFSLLPVVLFTLMALMEAN